MAKVAAIKARSKDKIDRRTGVKEAVEMGIAAVEQGDHKQAHSIFRQTAELHPNISEVWLWLGGTSPNLEDAESAFEKAYTIDPDNEQASLGLRWVRLRRKASLVDIVDVTVPVATVVEHTPSSGVGLGSSTTAPAVTTVKCANCGKANVADETFCIECGQDLSATSAEDEHQHTSPAPKQGKQGLPARTVVFAAVVLVAIAVTLLAFMLLHAH